MNMNDKDKNIDPLAALMGAGTEAEDVVEEESAVSDAGKERTHTDLKKFMVALPLDVHAALRLRAATDGVTMNQWVTNVVKEALADDIAYVVASPGWKRKL